MGKWSPFNANDVPMRKTRKADPKCYIGKRGEDIALKTRKLNRIDRTKGVAFAIMWLLVGSYCVWWFWSSTSIQLTISPDSMGVTEYDDATFTTRETGLEGILGSILGDNASSWGGVIGWLMGSIGNASDPSSGWNMTEALNETMSSDAMEALMDELGITEMNITQLLEYVQNGTILSNPTLQTLLFNVLTEMWATIIPEMIPAAWWDPLYLVIKNTNVDWWNKYYVATDVYLRWSFSWNSTTATLIDANWDRIASGESASRPITVGNVLNATIQLMVPVLANITLTFMTNASADPSDMLMTAIMDAFLACPSSFALSYGGMFHWMPFGSSLLLDLHQIIGLLSSLGGSL